MVPWACGQYGPWSLPVSQEHAHLLLTGRAESRWLVVAANLNLYPCCCTDKWLSLRLVGRCQTFQRCLPWRRRTDVILLTTTDSTGLSIVVACHNVHASAFVLGYFHCVFEGRRDLSDGRTAKMAVLRMWVIMLVALVVRMRVYLCLLTGEMCFVCVVVAERLG
jgi:hypothetical protein